MVASQPVLHLLAGPNGSGKSTIYRYVLADVLAGLPFVNADEIAAERWPGDELRHAYEASRLAEAARDELLVDRRSFVSETVFSHASKVELVRGARHLGYHVTLYVVAVPVELAVARVRARVGAGGHDVPEEKIRSRWERLWPIVRTAIADANEALVFDNSGRSPVRLAEYTHGQLTWSNDAPLPPWLPTELLS